MKTCLLSFALSSALGVDLGASTGRGHRVQLEPGDGPGPGIPQLWKTLRQGRTRRDGIARREVADAAGSTTPSTPHGSCDPT